MKRIISLVLCVALTLSLASACSGEPKPHDYLTENCVTVGTKCIAFLDEFLNGDRSAAETALKLDLLANRLDKSETYENLFHIHLSSVGTFLALYDSKFGTTTKQDIKESRDKLYDFLYK